MSVIKGQHEVCHLKQRWMCWSRMMETARPHHCLHATERVTSMFHMIGVRQAGLSIRPIQHKPHWWRALAFISSGFHLLLAEKSVFFWLWMSLVLCIVTVVRTVPETYEDKQGCLILCFLGPSSEECWAQTDDSPRPTVPQHLFTVDDLKQTALAWSPGGGINNDLPFPLDICPESRKIIMAPKTSWVLSNQE